MHFHLYTENTDRPVYTLTYIISISDSCNEYYKETKSMIK